MSSHHTYIPWFNNEPLPNEGYEEAKLQLKIPRLCMGCQDFKSFNLKEITELWIFLYCPTCGEILKIPRKRNYAHTKWNEKKWK
ncbi:MAG: hypothetical protein JXA54_10245 [Candidatus Heimdallarchaeota archaeon]|nr:hypothetical protein [Candidatus Heimdallarchaeota archaeon]